MKTKMIFFQDVIKYLSLVADDTDIVSKILMMLYITLV
jgi:hypothetical protein